MEAILPRNRGRAPDGAHLRGQHRSWTIDHGPGATCRGVTHEEAEGDRRARARQTGLGQRSGSLRTVASVDSAPLDQVLRHQNVDSRNFYAETLGKLLGATEFGAPGTIHKGAKAIEQFARSRGVDVTAHDNSGLSYDDRVTTSGIVRLLWSVGPESWDDELRSTLPTGGQGTLVDRLRGVRVRAKTGTLTDVSALSGWVWMRQERRWAQFSILDAGMSKTPASRIEDGIVRAVARKATCAGCAPAIAVP